MRASKARKKTAFVPRIVFSAAVVGVGVVPVCVTACGAETTTDSPPTGVAQDAFADEGDASPGVALDAFSSSDARVGQDASVVGVANIGFVAEMAFVDAGDAGDASNGREAGRADASLVGVGASAFTDGGDSGSPSDATSAVDSPIFTVAYHGFEGGH